jgi:hypothetical protein
MKKFSKKIRLAAAKTPDWQGTLDRLNEKTAQVTPVAFKEVNENCRSSMTFTIANDYDPDGDMSGKANPVIVYRVYLRDVRGGVVGGMGLPWAILKPTSPSCGSPIGRKSSQP